MPCVAFETLIPLTPNHSWVIEVFRGYESRVSDDAPGSEDDVVFSHRPERIHFSSLMSWMKDENSILRILGQLFAPST